MANPPPPIAAAVMMAAVNNVLAAAQVATQQDLANAVAPLATQAQLNALQQQLNAQLNAQQQQLNALAVQVAALPTLAQIQALLAPHNAPAIAAAAAATVQAITSARMHNAHDRSG